MAINQSDLKIEFTCQVISKLTNQISNLYVDYDRLASKYEEISDAKKVREKASQLLDSYPVDYDRVITLMNLAIKIMKSCNAVG